MKIIATVRTRNEESNIERFCMSYQWADSILVADGGSDDRTVEIASRMPNTQVRGFHIRIPMRNGLWRNPHGAHINYLIDWATEEGADWIIFDDCDCFPNALLKRDGRWMMETTKSSYINAVRLYAYGKDQHFRKLAQPVHDGVWSPSAWAWRASTGWRFKEDHPEKLQEMIYPAPVDQSLDLLPPYCLVHHPWPTNEAVEKKLNYYRLSYEVPNMLHPLEFGGALEPLPDWAEE